MNKQEDELYISITLFDKDESKRKEYKTSNISEKSCKQAYELNEKILKGICNKDDLLHDLINFMMEFFDNQFTYQDVVFGIKPEDLSKVISILFMICGSQMAFEGQQEKAERLLGAATNLYNEAVK
ncbi:phage tail assembly chaperone G [Cellulosilyticum sp. WCF-2]|uniref:phage tail assembly chaperone G n=1 Tax=Cellulosilyticum sp. WCF-2 TaxID=2497860 RepID=UPI000F8D18E1|nr:hypothetical protein [Cellulosilyticum sp. WCF-2]QEH68696.1 hypothetical protein EKH84_10025 [Cellulosilyticum sp. WCF-2]